MEPTIEQELANVRSLKSRDCWQKFCAAEDWFHEDFRFFVKSILHENPTFRRKPMGVCHRFS